MSSGAVSPPVGNAESEKRLPQPSRFLARQPILNARSEVVAYELLFRSGWENCFQGEPNAATMQTLDQFLYMGIESLTDNQLAFVNCTRESLVGRLVTVLPCRTTVLEILETIEPDAELLAACLELRRMGYQFALDDFVPRKEMRPLVEIASYIKVDFRISDASQRREIRRMIRGSKAALLAEKVEDQEEFAVARAEGYTHFQGYFFCRPKVFANREIPPNRINYLRLMAELARQPLDLAEVIRIVRLETSLCYRLLRLANSPLLGIRNDVTSVRDAFMLVGEDRFRALASVAASCVMGEGQPTALITLSVERARFCELLAPLIEENPTEQFLLGLLSLLDAMLQTPMESIAQALPLRAEAKAALLGSGQSGRCAALFNSKPRIRGLGKLRLCCSRGRCERRNTGPALLRIRAVGSRYGGLKPVGPDQRQWRTKKGGTNGTLSVPGGQ
jgi:EAL and modified HD-GYP domain-containing signal transduction protein